MHSFVESRLRHYIGLKIRDIYLGFSRVWADWYNAAEIEWNYAEERRAEEHRAECEWKRLKRSDRSTSGNYHLLQKHRGSLFQYCTGTICIEYSGYLLSRIPYCYRKYTKMILISLKYKVIYKISVYRCPRRINDVGQVRILLYCYELRSICILLCRTISEYKSPYKMYYIRYIRYLLRYSLWQRYMIVYFRAKWSATRRTSHFGMNWVLVKIETSTLWS